MHIHLSSTAQLELPAFPTEGEIDIPDGTTVGAFLDLAGVRKEHQKFILAMVNKKKVNRMYQLTEGDSLFLMVPIGGG